ncbi:MAG: InlB B-repeat-containing protein [Lachnospiraceae bacterium]|nr:InlB B-repeat-containing protein [Lachnospiraceae bacterium]
MKRVIGIVLTVIMLLAMLPVSGQPAKAAETYTVTFNSMGGSYVPPQTVEAGGYAVKPDDPFNPGWGFYGWYTDDYMGQQFNFSWEITEDITLYAGWASDIVLWVYPSSTGKVGMDLGYGWDYANASFGALMRKHENKNFYIDAKPNAGYRFKEWRRDNPVNGSVFATVASTYITKDGPGARVRLYAVFEPDPTSLGEYQIETGVTPYGTGTTSGDGWYTGGDSVTVSAVPEEGYKFGRWLEKTYDNYQPVYTQVSTSANYTFTADSDRVLIAEFDSKDPEYYTVTFDTSQARFPVETPEPQLIEEGKMVTRPPDPVQPGWHFEGWFLDDHMGEQWNFTRGVDRNITLYAGWSISVNVYASPSAMGQIGWFDGDDMIYTSSLGAAYFSYKHDPWILEAVPGEGYTFEGWRIGSQHGELYSKEASIEFIPDGNIQLFAMFGGEVTGITLSETAVKVGMGQSHYLEATITPTTAQNQFIVWESSKPAYATVNDYGEIYGRSKIGKSVISATTVDGGYVAKCNVQTMFTDVMGSPNSSAEDYQYYYKPVYWAALNGITNGYTDEHDSRYGMFGADFNCTRGALMVFLWRLAGKPSVAGIENPFNDVDESVLGSTYYKAILWGYNKGITKGYPDGGFHPDDPVVRKDIMIMLYRFAGKPPITNPKEMTFTDVIGVHSPNSDTYKAILWGYSLGITNGYSSGEYAGQFGCMLDCLRKDIVTFLYRYKGKPKVDY